MKRQWFQIKAEADGASADIYIFGLIGDWIDDLWGFDDVTTAKSFVDELAKLPATVKTLRVRINSPGGDVFGGLTIANTLRAEQTRGRKVETIIEGLAASAASVIAMGGGEIRIADNALMMVHDPWSVAVGNARDMRATAEILDQMRDALVKTYQWHSKLNDEEIVALIEGEDGQGSWLDADEAIANGLATEKIEGLKAAASIDPRSMAKLKVPERFAARVSALLKSENPQDPPGPALPAAEAAAKPEDVIGLCATAGLDIAFANRLLKDKVTPAQAHQLVGEEKGRRAAEAQRQESIRALCDKFKVADLAPELISGGMPFDAARALVAKVTGMVDRVEIDAGLNPDQGSRPKAVIDVQAVYAERNRLRH